MSDVHPIPAFVTVRGNDGEWRGQGERGFTLVEMMVALFIFGMIASASVFLLRQSVEAEARSAVRLEEMGDLRRFSAILAQDMTLMLPRPSRDAVGSDRVALMSGDGLLLGFTRQVPQIDPQPGASSLQRVEWALVDGRLTRATAPKADGAATSAPVPILEGIESVQMRYRDRLGVWQPDWRPQRTDELPIAIELSLAQAGNPGAPLVMQFLVAGGGG
ncbi:type II secretion system minor pseudopilin GspJ [Blastomonas fulva]|uniref:type II secretion system minor pseudopilin GspJ n=1 Tax=Blastomonas fulva TaxID=1550728 RepID=UPI0025A44B64|nr:type II secretion system minor pseudopilin GspJ [Blastomonas fulva]MDM7929298.1 type II secretion system minor pseudopilin GspJ [Blastomonas fulva]MDM7966068.1 type II secretion system minor pseudopilin GspJ [Blastomonas fulva]